MENPNHSNDRYRERDNREIKRSAFDKKEGYKSNYSSKEKDMHGGMRMPAHMNKKDCP